MRIVSSLKEVAGVLVKTVFEQNIIFSYVKRKNCEGVDDNEPCSSIAKEIPPQNGPSVLLFFEITK